METTVKINGEEKRVKASAFSPFLYQDIFDRNLDEDVVHIAQNDAEAYMVISRMLYAFLCQANTDLVRDKKHFEVWLDDIDEEQIIGAATSVIELYTANKTTKVKIKKKTGAVDRPSSLALVLLRCKELGLSIADMQEISYGMMIDMISERGNDAFYQEHPPAKLATQADMDRFARG